MIIYLRHDNKTDYNEPLIVKKGATVIEIAEKISLELKNEVKSAKVWGKSVKFPGQTVSLKHQLIDSDILYLVK